MYPVNLAGPNGQALVRMPVTWSALDSVPPPRRTFGAGQVAVACDWVFGGLSTVRNTSLYPTGLFAQIALTANCAVAVPALLTRASQPALPLGWDVLTVRLALAPPWNATPPPHTTVPAGHAAEAPESKALGGALKGPACTIVYPGGWLALTA